MTSSKPIRRPRRDALENRAGIIAAAQRVLAVEPHASLDAIAHAVGLSRRALYGHFADREALLREVIALGTRRFNDIALAIDDPEPTVALARLAVRLWGEASAVRASANIALDDAHVADTALSLEPLRRRLREIAEAGILAGTIRADIDAAMLACLLETCARAFLRDTTNTAAIAARMVLSVAGLSWREQAALLLAHPDLLEEE